MTVSQQQPETPADQHSGLQQATTHWRELLAIWLSKRSSSHSGELVRWLTGGRIEHELPNLPLAATSWEELVLVWGSGSTSPTLQQLIEARLAKMIQQVTADNCPSWFIALLHYPDQCPVRSVLDEKARQLCLQLLQLSLGAKPQS